MVKKMKKMKWMAWVLGLLLVVPASAVAIELTDYIDPDIYWQDAEVSAMLTVRDGNRDQTSYDAYSEVDWELEYSTLPMKWRAAAIGTLDLNRGPDDDDDSQENITFDAWSDAKLYQTEAGNGLFYFGRAEYGYRNIEAQDLPENNRAEAIVGAGYGRIITATPLMEAIRAVEDLQRYGIIQGAVSDATYLKLAAVIAKEQEYQSRYSLREYEKFWYEAMEEILRNEGVLADETLGAMGVIRIQDILTVENVQTRKHGWEARAGLGFQIIDYSGNEADPLFRAALEYAKPFGLQWQFMDTVTYATILEDFDFGDTDHNFANIASLTYEINETIDWINIWRFDVIVPSDGDDDETYINHLETGLEFYITNTVDLVTRLEFDHYDHGDNPDDEVETTFFVGVTYTIF